MSFLSLYLHIFSVAALFAPPSRMVSRRPYKSDGSGSPLVIDYNKLSDLLGKPTGKSKFMCVQFCLSVAELAGDRDLNNQIDLDISSDGDRSEDTDVNLGEGGGDGDGKEEKINKSIQNDSNSESDDDSGIGDGKYGVKGEGEGGGGEEDSNTNASVTPLLLLEAAKVAALKGLNDRSGVASVGNAMILFINCFDIGGADRAPASMRKYANQFLIDGQYFTWFVDARRWAGKIFGTSEIGRASCRERVLMSV